MAPISPDTHTLVNDKESPPTYQDATSNSVTMGNRNTRPIPQNFIQAPVAPQQTPFRFPQSVGIYHASGSFSDMVLAQQKDDPNPLFYVSTHGGFSSQPSVVLHSSRSSTSPPLATASFHSFSSTIDITLHVSLPQNSRPQVTSLETTSAFSSARAFRAPIPSTGRLETFEWKNSSGAEVQRLGGKGSGKKCIRQATGEVVAAFTYPDMSMNKKGKVAFVGNRGILGEGFEVLLVMSILAIIEKERRARKSRHAAGGMGGGVGMGGGAGGGGC